MSQAFQRWMEHQWYHRTAWQIILRPFAWIFWLLMIVRRLAYRVGLLKSRRLPVPVIIVGNIHVGGTGKTPFVIWLVQQLRQNGWYPGVVSRGYGGSALHTQQVKQDSTPEVVGDEPVLLVQRTNVPLYIGRKRSRAARYLLRDYPECNLIISDDGLQHYALKRDIEIAIVDGERMLGNGQLLPAGPLRETSARLKEVDAVVFNGGPPAADSYLMHLVPDTLRQVSYPESKMDISALVGKRVHAVAGIGNPQRFFGQLESMGLIVEAHAFPDHHIYSEADFQFAKDEIVLMTEKDAVKCTGFARDQWWFMPITAEIDRALAEKILTRLTRLIEKEN
ncbi:lipid-A-disaccharide kinase [Methylobacillus rhizosphaerae]|uniref:Tetraacyldisaccharide 4'-kinase n=1 Tax=Methylobacillus rhizosphaerae TaxID=551994 RepID=A0A238Y787_9PROT|nr:tetraacyldisaccharide 4'-kinase [Methylobacillus rhizosphaerae]SNR66199.1 lipid-A-disaccharide kinase [Methylobacillus rhizosphaerae]